MRKILAFLLACVLIVSVIGTVSAAEFSDASKISVYDTEAVEILSDLKIITGFPDGTFKPTDILTRAQAAKILCCIALGNKKAEELPAGGTSFADVPASHWANKYVEYCAAQKIVAGVGDGKFNPDGKLTGFAFGKMLLVALGADANTLTGAGWDTNTLAQLTAKHLDYGVTVDGSNMDRQSACRLALNAMFDGEKEFPENTLAYKSFQIVRKQKGNNNDLYSRPYMIYSSQFEDIYWKGIEKKITASPIRIHPNGPITGDAFVKLLGVKDLKISQLDVYRNGIAWSSSNSNVKDVWHEGNRELYFRAENGMRLEFYYNAVKDVYTVVHVPNFCGKITAATEPVLNADGSVKTHGSVTFETYGTCPADCFKPSDVGSYGLFNGTSKKTWTAVQKANEGVATTYVTGKLEAAEKDVSVTVDGKVYPYPYIATVAVTADKYLESGGAIGDTVRLALDAYGFCYAVWK